MSEEKNVISTTKKDEDQRQYLVREIKNEKIVCDAFTIDIHVMQIYTDPAVNVYHVDVFDKQASWQETFTTQDQLNAFLRGMSAHASFSNKLLPLLRFDFRL